MVEPGHFVVIVCDGAAAGIQFGHVFLPEFAQLFVDQGCTTAYNLDGGVSACMVFMGEQLNQHGNKRVGTYQDSYQRRVPDGLVWVIRIRCRVKTTRSTTPARAIPPPRDGERWSFGALPQTPLRGLPP
jgi:hypothetical protein